MSSRKKNQEEEPKEGRMEGDKRKFLALVTREDAMRWRMNE